MTQKMHCWQTTNKLWLAVCTGGAWLIGGLGDLVYGIVAGEVLAIALGSIFLLCGVPWYITAIALLRRRAVAFTSR
jgi:uncharacterized membrane protein HdeD (DUF308 family)